MVKGNNSTDRRYNRVLGRQGKKQDMLRGILFGLLCVTLGVVVVAVMRNPVPNTPAVVETPVETPVEPALPEETPAPVEDPEAIEAPVEVETPVETVETAEPAPSPVTDTTGPDGAGIADPVAKEPVDTPVDLPEPSEEPARPVDEAPVAPSEPETVPAPETLETPVAPVLDTDGPVEPAAPVPADETPAVPAFEDRPIDTELPSTNTPSEGSEITAPEAVTPEPAPVEKEVIIILPENIPAADRPSVLRVPVPGSGLAVPDVRTGRLPTVGDDAVAEDADPEEFAPADTGALSANAVPFLREPAADLFSVILIDVGEDGLDRDALTTFSFPVTFAIDATRPDAAEAASIYRASGYEVILIPGPLPEGANARDVETNFEQFLSIVPVAVAVMDAPEGRAQTNRTQLQALTAILSATGHGLVSMDQGLNTAQQVAATAGVPHSLVFRTLDADRENASTVQRYLDRAAFKAGQEGSVVMIGHTYDETVKGLFSWALEGKSESIQLAPISAVLTGQ